MPIKILFIEDSITSQESINSLLHINSGINYKIIDSFNLLNTEINSNYTHLVSCYSINNQTINDFIDIIEIPTLVVTENDIKFNSSKFNLTKYPLSYFKLFSFLCEKQLVFDDTLEKYAMGDQDFMSQLKAHIVEEFELNIHKMPQYIKSQNLKEIKNLMHQLVSKFSLLEMDSTYDLSREIDLNILEQPEIQIANTQQVLVDVEIALTQLK